ncbi:MAG: LPS export ABC transporter periplasmic protein LptC [Novosphingobium sp.]
MTLQADLIRDQRRRFAAPGGSHDRLVGFLAKALPVTIGGVAAVMVLAPLSPRGEVSFLLDRRKVQVSDARIDVDKAVYRGADNQGRPFEVTAGKAIQRSPGTPVVELRGLSGRLQLSDGPAQISAPAADYNYSTSTVSSRQPVSIVAGDGYRMVMNNVDIDLTSRIAVGGAGGGGVSGAVPTGTFSADRIRADIGARTVALEGRARLRMVPGKLRMPK